MRTRRSEQIALSIHDFTKMTKKYHCKDSCELATDGVPASTLARVCFIFVAAFAPLKANDFPPTFLRGRLLDFLAVCLVLAIVVMRPKIKDFGLSVHSCEIISQMLFQPIMFAQSLRVLPGNFCIGPFEGTSRGNGATP